MASPINDRAIQRLRDRGVAESEFSRHLGVAKATTARAVRGGSAAGNVPASPKTVNGHRISTAQHGVTHPLNYAEVAQARIFDGILRAELVQLEELAKSIASRWMGPANVRTGDSQQPEELVQLRARIEEAHRLIDALWQRFLHSNESNGS
jgi:hypothetical protein